MTMDNNEKLAAFAGLAEKSLMSGGLVNVVFHSPAAGDILKAKGTSKTIAGKTVPDEITDIQQDQVCDTA